MKPYMVTDNYFIGWKCTRMQHVFTDRGWSVRAGDTGMVQNMRTCFVSSIKSHSEPTKVNVGLNSTLLNWQWHLVLKGSLGGYYQIVHVNVSRRLIINTTEGGVTVRPQGARELVTEAIDVISVIQSIRSHCVLQPFGDDLQSDV